MRDVLDRSAVAVLSSVENVSAGGFARRFYVRFQQRYHLQ